MAIYNISIDVEEKLRKKHSVALTEVSEAFLNRNGGYFEDQREDHKTNPVTEWFIARTNKNRLIKVCFIYEPDRGTTIKSAFDPDGNELALYMRLTGLSEEDI